MCRKIRDMLYQFIAGKYSHIKSHNLLSPLSLGWPLVRNIRRLDIPNLRLSLRYDLMHGAWSSLTHVSSASFPPTVLSHFSTLITAAFCNKPVSQHLYQHTIRTDLVLLLETLPPF